MSQQGYNNLKVFPKTEGQSKKVSSRSYRGFSTVNGELSTALYDFELIKQDLINHFHIRKGEKLENPNFGTIIWDMIFEQMTEQTKSMIVNDVNDIVNSDPRTRAIRSIVTEKEQGIQIELTLLYVPYNIQETLQFNFDNANGLI